MSLPPAHAAPGSSAQPSPTTCVRQPAPAKINLTLGITGRRADGYHLLASLVVFAELGDEITLNLARQPTDAASAAPPSPPPSSLSSTSSAEPALTLTGPFADPLRQAIAAGVTPSPITAIRLLDRAVRRHTGRPPPYPPAAMHITLDKHLPLASGMGGGTSDAAATFKAAATMWGVELTPADWTALALEVGADGPACFTAQALWMTGIGEQIRPLRAWPALPVVLVNPRSETPTPEIFRRYAKAQIPFTAPPAPPDAHTIHDALAYLRIHNNDLTPAAAALLPEINAILDAMNAHPNVALARMTGSGATVFGVCETIAAAQQVSKDLSTRYPHYWVTHTTVRPSPLAVPPKL